MIYRALTGILLLFFMGYAQSVPIESAEADSPDGRQILSFEMKPVDEKPINIRKIVFALFLALSIVIVAAVLLKKILYKDKQIFPNSSLISLTASKKISMKMAIHLVEVEDFQYLIVEKDNAISILPHGKHEKVDAML